jgi:hypothetical protein
MHHLCTACDTSGHEYLDEVRVYVATHSQAAVVPPWSAGELLPSSIPPVILEPSETKTASTGGSL